MIDISSTLHALTKTIFSLCTRSQTNNRCIRMQGQSGLESLSVLSLFWCTFSLFLQALTPFNVLVRGDAGKLGRVCSYLIGYVGVASASHLTFSRMAVLKGLVLSLACSGWLPGLKALHSNPKSIGTLKLTLLPSRWVIIPLRISESQSYSLQPLSGFGRAAISACQWLLTPPFSAVPMLALGYWPVAHNTFSVMCIV